MKTIAKGKRPFEFDGVKVQCEYCGSLHQLENDDHAFAIKCKDGRYRIRCCICGESIDIERSRFPVAIETPVNPKDYQLQNRWRLETAVKWWDKTSSNRLQKAVAGMFWLALAVWAGMLLAICLWIASH